MASKVRGIPGIPNPEDIELIAPDEHITADLLSLWVESGTSRDAGVKRAMSHRWKNGDRKAKPKPERQGPSDAVIQSAKMSIDELVEIDDISTILNGPGQSPRRQSVPMIDFGPAQRNFEDEQGDPWDWRTDYYGKDDERGAAQELGDALDGFFSDSAVSIDGGTPHTGLRVGKPVHPMATSGGQRHVVPTPLASDFDEDDYDDGEENHRYSSLFAMPDADDRPFSVWSLGKGETRHMSTTLQRFLDGNVNLGPQICALWKGFPVAYGIAVGRQRYSGFAARPTRSILTGDDFGEVTHMSVARIRSYDRFMRDLADGEPYAVEFLGVDQEDILYIDSSARAILESADAFLSKRCGQRALEVANDLIRKIGRPVEQDEPFGAERRIRAIHAIDQAKEDFTEAYGRFARIYVDVQNHMGRPTVMASMNLREMPLSEMSGLAETLDDIASAYSLVADMRGATVLKGEALAHAMCEVVRIMQTASQLLDGEGLQVTRKTNTHVLEGIMRGRLIGPDGRPMREYWDIVDEEQLRLEDSIDLTDLPDQADLAEVSKLIAARNRDTVLEDA